MPEGENNHGGELQRQGNRMGGIIGELLWRWKKGLNECIQPEKGKMDI
jgi:hypothetical protein